MVRRGIARNAAVLATIVVGCCLPAWAHHSFSAEFSADEPATLTGTLARFDWVNPHVWLYVDVKGPDGRVTRWAVECGAPNAMMRRGAGRDVLAVGAEIVVDGYLARSGNPIVKGRSLRWPSGATVNIGTPGTGAPGDLPVDAAIPAKKE